MALLEELNNAWKYPKLYGQNIGIGNDLKGFKHLPPLDWDIGLGIEAQKLSDYPLCL